MGLVFILLVSVAGAYGSQAWQKNRLNAKAAGWTPLQYDNSKGYIKYARACQTPTTNKFGKFYNVKFEVYRNNAMINNIYMQVVRPSASGNTVVSQPQQNEWGYGVVATTSAIASANLKDYVR